MNSEYKRVEYSLMCGGVAGVLLESHRYCATGQAGTPFWISLDKAEKPMPRTAFDPLRTFVEAS